MNELERRHHPRYPEPAWHGALVRAVQADEAARITEITDQGLSAYDAGQLTRRKRDRLELEARLVGARCSSWLARRGLTVDYH